MVKHYIFLTNEEKIETLGTVSSFIAWSRNLQANTTFKLIYVSFNNCRHKLYEIKHKSEECLKVVGEFVSVDSEPESEERIERKPSG